MYGGRISLTLSLAVVIINTIIGVIIGGLAGYIGKWLDMIVMRIIDVINCIPTLPILLIVSAILDAYKDVIDPQYNIYIMMGILTLLSWTGIARLVRGQILFLREQECMLGGGGGRLFHGAQGVPASDPEHHSSADRQYDAEPREHDSLRIHARLPRPGRSRAECFVGAHRSTSRKTPRFWRITSTFGAHARPVHRSGGAWLQLCR